MVYNGGMGTKKLIDTALLDYLLAHISQNSSTVGMKSAAAKHFGVDRCTITRALSELRRQKRLGRDVFRKWRDSRDS